MENVMNILLGIVALVVSTGGGYLIKYLSGKIGSEKMQKYYTLIKTVVMSIEQTQSTLTGEQKKALAVSKIKELTNNLLSEEEIDRLVEAAVYEVKKLLSNNSLS